MRVGGVDSAGDGEHVGVVRGVLPGLEVVAVPPDDVPELLVATPEELSVCLILCDAVLLEDVEPAARLDRIEEDDDAVACRHADDRVDPREVGGIRSRQVARGAKRRDPVNCLRVGAATRVRRTEQVYPDRVEAGLLPVGEVGGCLLQVQVPDERLRRVARDQERLTVLVDEIAPTSGDLERKDEAAARGSTSGSRARVIALPRRGRRRDDNQAENEQAQAVDDGSAHLTSPDTLPSITA